MILCKVAEAVYAQRTGHDPTKRGSLVTPNLASNVGTEWVLLSGLFLLI